MGNWEKLTKMVEDQTGKEKALKNMFVSAVTVVSTCPEYQSMQTNGSQNPAAIPPAESSSAAKGPSMVKPGQASPHHQHQHDPHSNLQPQTHSSAVPVATSPSQLLQI